MFLSLALLAVPLSAGDAAPRCPSLESLKRPWVEHAEDRPPERVLQHHIAAELAAVQPDPHA